VYYEQLVSGALFAPNPNAVVKSERKRVPDGRKRVAYTKLLLGLFFLGLYAVGGTNLDYDRVVEPAFMEKSYFSRCVAVYCFCRNAMVLIWNLLGSCLYRPLDSRHAPNTMVFGYSQRYGF
jgi:hypothetical protein